MCLNLALLNFHCITSYHIPSFFQNVTIFTMKPYGYKGYSIPAALTVRHRHMYVPTWQHPNVNN